MRYLLLTLLALSSFLVFSQAPLNPTPLYTQFSKSSLENIVGAANVNYDMYIFNNGFYLAASPLSVTSYSSTIQYTEDYYDYDNGYYNYNQIDTTLQSTTLSVNFRMGSRWYVTQGEQLRLAVDVRWLDLTLSPLSLIGGKGCTTFILPSPGALLTYALTEETAIDIRGHVGVGIINTNHNNSIYNTFGVEGFATNYSIMGSYRYHKFFVGLGLQKTQLRSVGDYNDAKAFTLALLAGFSF